MLQRGDQVPHFRVRRLSGAPFDYSAVWQHRSVVVVSLADVEATTAAAFAATLMDRESDFSRAQGESVVTRDRVAGLPAPGVLIADRWGEIVHVRAVGAADLPSPEELLEWLHYVQMRCPECEGEAK